jgi:hypothetical protein
MFIAFQGYRVFNHPIKNGAVRILDQQKPARHRAKQNKIEDGIPENGTSSPSQVKDRRPSPAKPAHYDQANRRGALANVRWLSDGWATKCTHHVMQTSNKVSKDDSFDRFHWLAAARRDPPNEISYKV